MKKIITLFLISFFFLSCEQKIKEENYKRQIKTYFEKTMHDPDSYQLESFNLMNNEIAIPVKILINAKKELMEENLSNEIYNIKSDSIVKEYSKIYEKALIKVRGKNAFGAKTMNRYSANFERGILVSVEE